ncbi:MAG: sugar transferase [Bradyrhizobium sp.]
MGADQRLPRRTLRKKIRSRVEHDLYYIDNWSLWFDIKILWLTLASKQAYTDAF